MSSPHFDGVRPWEARVHLYPEHVSKGSRKSILIGSVAHVIKSTETDCLLSRKVDPCGPMTLDNLSLHYNLMDSWDLTVFFLVPLLVELAGVPAVHALVRCQAAIKVMWPKITNMFNHSFVLTPLGW